MNIPINNEDLKKALFVAKEIIDEEEFELVIVNNPKPDTKEHLFYEENGFYLQDTTGTNLGGIESERFDTLAEVIDRLDIYHNDYFWEADCDRTADELDPVNYDLENVAFLESDYCAELLSQITPAKYDELAYEGALELGHNSKAWSDNIRYLLNKEIAYKIIETQSAYVMCEYIGKVYLSDYDTYTDADRMLRDVVYARGDKYYHLGDTTTAFCRYNGASPEYCFNEYQSYKDIVAPEVTQILLDMKDVGLTDNGAWNFYLSPKELMIAGVPYGSIKKALEYEKELENKQSEGRIYEVCFDDENYMHFNVNADGYCLDGLFRVHDTANGKDMTIVSIDNGYEHPSIMENWNDIEKQCRMAALEKYTEITGKQYVFENTKDEPDITDDM